MKNYKFATIKCVSQIIYHLMFHEILLDTYIYISTREKSSKKLENFASSN